MIKRILRSIFPEKQVKKARYRIREIIRKSKQLHTLLEINEKILTEQSLSELLNHIVRSVVDLLKVDAGSLRLADEEQSLLILKSTCGTHRKSGQVDLPINEESTAGLSYLKRTPVKSSDISKEPLYPFSLLILTISKLSTILMVIWLEIKP